MQLMSLIGSDGVVAYGIVMYVNYIATGIYMGYSVGIAPVFGYHLGAKNHEEIKNGRGMDKGWTGLLSQYIIEKAEII